MPSSFGLNLKYGGQREGGFTSICKPVSKSSINGAMWPIDYFLIKRSTLFFSFQRLYNTLETIQNKKWTIEKYKKNMKKILLLKYIFLFTCYHDNCDLYKYITFLKLLCHHISFYSHVKTKAAAKSKNAWHHSQICMLFCISCICSKWICFCPVACQMRDARLYFCTYAAAIISKELGPLHLSLIPHNMHSINQIS